jgi:hypothetical protein
VWYLYEIIPAEVLQVGDALVLCDAGGGTVDLISYEITNLEPLELKELVPCTGATRNSYSPH